MARLPKFYEGLQKVKVEKKVPFVRLVYTIAGFNLALIIFVFVFKNRLPPVVPLFYGQAEGEKQLASNSALIIPSLLSLGFLSLNTIFAYILKDDFLKKALVLTALGATFFSAITTIKIFVLVGNL